MVTIGRSPFKVNVVERDPNAFGIRIKEIVESVEALYNNRSILLSGQRGIGKTSMGIQLQEVMKGNQTLLQRSGIECQFEKTFCVFHACDSISTIEQISLDILHKLEKGVLNILKPRDIQIEPEFEVNLGFIKTNIKTSLNSGTRSPATTASNFVEGLITIQKTLNKHRKYRNINIMIDELDQLPKSENFGHFIKITHDTLNYRQQDNITFIFSGQSGVYSDLLNGNLSFERIVRHIPLTILDPESCEHILNYAAKNATPKFIIDTQAKNMIIAISSGFPYIIHLLGDAAFWEMKKGLPLEINDVYNGLEKILLSDKREKYTSRFMNLSKEEKIILVQHGRRYVDVLPAEVPIEWLRQKSRKFDLSSKNFDIALESLIKSGHVFLKEKGSSIIFCEELFRIFINLLRIEQEQYLSRNKKDEISKEQELIIIQAISAGEISNKDLQEFSSSQRKEILDEFRRFTFGTGFSTSWEDQKYLIGDEYIDYIDYDDEEFPDQDID